VSELKKVVDELGELGEQLVAAKKVVAAYNKARARFIELACAGVEAEQSVVAIGQRYTAAASACGIQKITNNKLVFRYMNADDFIALASFKQEDLKEHLSPTQLDEAVTEAQTGPRRVTVAATRT
jgi:hypothetical protein